MSMMMKPPTVPRDYVNAPSYEELVNALEQVRHATASTPDDGGHHEAAHDLADAMLKRVEARRRYEEARLTGHDRALTGAKWMAPAGTDC
jgi:hypothetical protein